jgi:hypothetical protein
MNKPFLPLALAAALGAASPSLSAGTYVNSIMTADEGFVVPLLEATSQRYVDAMRAIVAARHAADHDAYAWERLEDHMRTARVARFEYRYTTNGTRQKRIYYAMDGEPLGEAARRIFQSRPDIVPLDSASDDEDMGYEIEPVPLDEAELARMEAADEPFYTAFVGDEVRATVQPSSDSTLSASYIGGKHRALDAEFKVLRAVERDIAAGVVSTSEAELTGIVSGISCASCDHAAERFATRQGTDITITQLSRSVHPDVRNELLTAGKAQMRRGVLVNTATGQPWYALDKLTNGRAAQVRKALSPVVVDRTPDGAPLPGRRFRLGPLATERIAMPEDGTRALRPDC